MKKMRILAMWLCLLLAVGSLIGCNRQSDGVEQELTITVFMPNAGDPYFQNKSYGYYLGARMLEAVNPGLRIDLEMFDAGGYQYSERQISQIEDAIMREVDAIIVTATDGAALIPVVTRAMAAGIPVVNDDVLVLMDTDITISENSFRVGQNAAAFLARLMNGRGNVVLMKGPAGADLFAQRERGAKDEISRIPGMNVIGEQWHEMNINEGRRIMEDFIQAHGNNINAVWAGNSVVAMGAVEALRDAGFRPGQVRVVGIDLHDEAIRMMEQGWIDGLVPCQPVKLARMSLTYAVEAAMGQRIPPRIYTTDDMVLDFEAYTTFDTSDAMAPDGWRPRLR